MSVPAASQRSQHSRPTPYRSKLTLFETRTRLSTLAWAISAMAVWRRGRDLNPRYGCPYAAFRVRCDRPLCHLSGGVFRASWGKVESAGGRKIDAARRPEGKRRPACRRRAALDPRERPVRPRAAGWPHLFPPPSRRTRPPQGQAADLRLRLRLARAWQVARHRAQMARMTSESGAKPGRSPVKGVLTFPAMGPPKG